MTSALRRLMSKLALVIISLLSVSAFAKLPTHIQLSPGDFTTVFPTEMVTISCRKPPEPVVNPDILVPANTDAFSVAASCDHMKPVAGSNRVYYGLRLKVVSCEGKNLVLVR